MIGETISHYRILEKIGEGGMGMVYKAYDTRLNRTVALKFLSHPDSTDRDQNSRLLQEARAAAQLIHPNIAAVFECDTIEEAESHSVRTFIAMEYVEGETLKSLLARSSLSLDTVRSITTQLARALSAAHAKNVVHRDLKPGNIIVSHDGLVKILDFGVAKLLGDSTLSHAGDVIGTAAYMSPEQIQGGSVDVRSDVWGFGVTLFEMLTNQLPFLGEHSQALMYSIICREPHSLLDLRPDVPPDIARLCAQCLQKNPDDRPQQMSEVLRMLGESSRETLRLGRYVKIARIALPLAVVLGIVVWFLQHSGTPPNVPTASLRVAVLPFQMLSFHNDSTDWPVALQSMFAQEMTGVEGIGVLEPFSLNSTMLHSLGSLNPMRDAGLYHLLQSTDIAFVVDGKLLKTNDDFKVLCSIVNTKTAELVYSCDTTVHSDVAVSSGIRALSHHIVSYFRVQVLSLSHNDELRPWLRPQAQNVDAMIAFIQAYRLSFNGIRGAERFLLRAVALDSTFIIPRVWLTFSYSRQGRTQEARRQYDALLNLEPHANPLEQAMIRWAAAVFDKDIHSQMRYLRSALDYSPGNNVILAQLAQAQYSLSDYRGALKTLLPTVSQKWNYSPAYYLLAACYDSLQEFQKAKLLLEQSIHLEHVVPEIYASLSRLERREGDTTGAREHETLYIQSSIESGLKPDEIYLSLARYALADAHYNEGIQYAKQALAADPTNPRAHEILAETLYFSGDLTTASLGFNTALQLDSTLTEAHAMLGMIFEQSAQPAMAIRHYRLYLKRDSTSSRAREIQNHLPALER